MHFEYTLTFAEFREGVTLVPIKNARAAKRAKWWSMIILVSALVPVFIALNSSLMAPASERASASSQNLWRTLAPSLAITTWFLAATLATAVRSWRIARASMATNTSTANHPPSVLLAIATALPWVFFLIPMFPVLEIRWSPTPGDVEWVQTLPWIVLQLITEDETVVIIPKRAIPDPMQMMGLRSLIQTKIARGNFLPSDARFPVVTKPA